MTARGTLARLRTARSTRTDAQRLARELGEFRSQSDLTELAATFARYDDGDTAELRRLVNWNAAA